MTMAGPDMDIRETTPCAFVIFGVAGDLARRKLLPSLYELWVNGRLHEETAIVGVARRDYDDAKFRDEVAAALEEFHVAGCTQTAEWRSFERTLHFAGFDLEDTDGYRSLYQRLSGFSEDTRVERQAVFYLSVPPEVFPDVVDHLDEAGLTRRRETKDGTWPRIVVEKPFGRDLVSSRALNDRLLASFDEESVRFFGLLHAGRAKGLHLLRQFGAGQGGSGDRLGFASIHLGLGLGGWRGRVGGPLRPQIAHRSGHLEAFEGGGAVRDGRIGRTWLGGALGLVLRHQVPTAFRAFQVVAVLVCVPVPTAFRTHILHSHGISPLAIGEVWHGRRAPDTSPYS